MRCDSPWSLHRVEGMSLPETAETMGVSLLYSEAAASSRRASPCRGSTARAQGAGAMNEPSKHNYSSYVTPELRRGRLDAQWDQISASCRHPREGASRCSRS